MGDWYINVSNSRESYLTSINNTQTLNPLLNRSIKKSGFPKQVDDLNCAPRTKKRMTIPDMKEESQSVAGHLLILLANTLPQTGR